MQVHWIWEGVELGREGKGWCATWQGDALCWEFCLLGDGNGSTARGNARLGCAWMVHVLLLSVDRGKVRGLTCLGKRTPHILTTGGLTALRRASRSEAAAAVVVAKLAGGWLLPTASLWAGGPQLPFSCQATYDMCEKH